MSFQKKILIIDGDQNFTDTIKASLTLHKYKVDFASDGAEGIQKALKYNPDLILCDFNLDTIDGCQVYKVLSDSFLLKGIPFIFLKHNATLEDVRHGMNLGADDFLSKPLTGDDLVKSIGPRLRKFKHNSAEVADEFNNLFQLSPNGILIFNEHAVLKANLSIKTLLKIKTQKSIPIKIEHLFESSSLFRIKSWIKQSLKGVRIVFNDSITMKDIGGGELKMNLVMSEFSISSDFVQFIGFFSPLPPVTSYFVNDQLANQICNLLKQEKIPITGDLEDKITYLTKQRTVDCNNQKKSFFTRRENQVLSLSMEGLPIKMIADKLSISTRTVEKHRTKLMEKAGAKNIVEVIVFSLKNGLIKI